MEFRKGDVVSVEGVVDFTVSGGSLVYVKPSKGEAQAFRPDVITLIARRFEPGEIVRSKHEQTHPAIRYEVIAVDGDQVWAKRADNGKRATFNAKDLEPAAPATVGFETKPFGWVAPPPGPDDTPPMLGETIVNGIRHEAYRLYGEVPPVHNGSGYGNEITYTTAEGDTLEAVAHVFGTSVDTIRVLNDIRHPATVGPGTTLKVPDNRIPF